MWDLNDVHTWLAAWDSQGIHRTATPGDDAGADWLAATATALGATVTQERFPLHRVDPIAGSVTFDNTTINGTPLFDAPDGTAQGNAGPIGHPAAAIGIAETDPRTVYSPRFRAMRETAPHAALVLVTVAEAPGLALLNAESFLAQYGPPVLQVSSHHAPALAQAAQRATPMRQTIRTARRPTHACNVVATVRGRDPTAPPLVVMTPRSSWWTSTSERGGGLVCWLACLKAILATAPQRDVIFTANSGHELGHIGLDAFIHTRPGWEQKATWLHWGANIGATGGRLSVMSAHDHLRQAMAHALTATGQPHTVASADLVPLRRNPGPASRRRPLHHPGRQQHPVPPAAGPPATRPGHRRGRPRRHRRGHSGLDAVTTPPHGLTPTAAPLHTAHEQARPSDRHRPHRPPYAPA